ncbi:MAG: type II toxin-antitoxin system VapC family toxin [Candidatus Binatia bacterium]
MVYWDASALVALCIEEETTEPLRRLLAGGIVTWAVSRVEIASAIERRSREKDFSPEARRDALAALDQLAGAWTEIQAVAPVCERATRLLATHQLRAADSMQLAAALVAVADRPGGHDFVCADHRLREAAGREGFRVLPESLS